MRIGIIAFLHESNTFISEPTTFDKFEQDVLLKGDGVRKHFEGSPHEVGGFFAGLAEQKLEAVPLFAARAYPFGTIPAETFDRVMGLMFAEVERAGKLDGYLVAPHGATVSADHPDADGYWLTRLRKTVGPNVPIVSTLDPHTNLSPAMVAACTAITAYRSNPHEDQRERGIEAASLLARTLRGEIRPTMAAAFPPIAMNIERQCTSEEPCRTLTALAAQQRTRPGVLSTSVILGFPYADVAEMGTAFVAVTDNNPALAQQLANELAAHMWEHRQEFAGRFITIDEGIDQSAKLPGPVCLLDMGDNVGGGGPGDSTLIAHALMRRRVPKSFVCLLDPEVVQQAEAAGVGKRARLRVGGKTDNLHGAPLEGEFTVVSLHDGQFHESEITHGGFTEFDQGRTAILRTDDGLTLMVTSKRIVPFSMGNFALCGLDPKSFQVIVAKGVNAPIAAYRRVCPHFVRVNTPGVTTADMRQLTYHRRRRPMFPFEPETVWRG